MHPWLPSRSQRRGDAIPIATRLAQATIVRWSICMESSDPVHKLVMAVLLASIRKRARAIRIVTALPMRVFFDFGDTCIEEMRPPDMLRERVMAALFEM